MSQKEQRRVMTTVRRKALAYITRQHVGHTQVAVFRHRDYPEAGIQVAKGTVEPDETPEQAVMREVAEESGLASGIVNRGEIGNEARLDAVGRRVERHYFHLSAPDDTPDTWDHTVTGHGNDTGLVFQYWWIDAPGNVSLADGQDAFLDAVLPTRISTPVGTLTFTPMTQEHARAVLAWHYDERYSEYDWDPNDDPDELLDRRSPYFAVLDERQELAGFFAYGTAAEPWNHADPALFVGDATMPIGLGMRPDLTGHGLGLSFTEAGLTFARQRYHPRAFVLYVLAWNERALRTYTRAGFECVGDWPPEGEPGAGRFIVMRRGA